MFSSSPSSSTGSPRLTKTHSAGPPRRTYARRKIRQVVQKINTSDTESDDDAGEGNDTVIRNDGKAEDRRKTIRPGANGARGTMSSPSWSSHTGTSVLGRRSSSRLSKGGSQTEEALTTTLSNGRGKSRTKAEVERATDDPNAKLVQEKEDGQVADIESRRKRARKNPLSTSSPLSSSSPSPSPTPKKRQAPSFDIEPTPKRPLHPPRSQSSPSSKDPVRNETKGVRSRDPATPPRTGPVAGPSTPSSSSPRDYAHLFAAITPDPTTLTSPSRKRMISQSQSSGAVLDSPSKLRHRFAHLQDDFGSRLAGPSTPTKLGKTNSLPISPSKSILDDAEPDPSAMWIKPVESEGPGSGGRAKRIYGRTRTVIAEDENTVSDVDKLEEALSKESYASLRSRYEVNPNGETSLSQAELSEVILARAPQSANDMKSKGENRRFMDETGYLLDGIEDESGTKGFRRASCVDILGNMQGDEWISKLRVCGQTERVWAAFQGVRGEGDDIMDAVCLLALQLIIGGDGGIEGILRVNAEGCVRFVTSLLKQRSGVLDEKWQGKVTPMIERVREIARNVHSKENSHPSSTRLFASSILSILTENYGDLLNSAFRSEKALGKTIKAILPEITCLAERFDLVESGLPVIPQDGSVDVDFIRNGLNVVDHIITASAQDRSDLAQHPAEIGQAVLQALIAFVSISGGDSELDGADEAAVAILSCLRIFANMSNASPAWSRDLLTTEGALTALARIAVHRSSISSRIATIQKKVSETADTTEEGELLCLVLAIITSGVLVDDNLASVLASLKLDNECHGLQDCLTYCKCFTAEPFVNELARLYASYHDQDSSDAASEVVSAYLALLLSKVVTAAPATLSDIAQSLPGDAMEVKLGNIMSSLRALDGYRSEIQRKWKDEVGVDVIEWQENGNEVQKAIDDMSRLVDMY